MAEGHNLTTMGKTFTLDEANRSLIFVAPVVKEIKTIWNELMTFKVNPTQTEFAEYSKEKTAREKLNRLKICMSELTQVGCILKEPLEGLVDFPSFYRDRPVSLCWHVGEEQADFWHPSEEGYENRQAIDEDFMEWNDKVPLVGRSEAEAKR